MAINEWKIWRKFGLRKVPEHERVEPVKDIDAILDFLELVNEDVKKLVPELKQLQELEKEKHIADDGLRQVNLETQGKNLTKILERYRSFQDDVDINGIRVKRIGQKFLEDCQRAGMKDYLREKKKDFNWKLKW
jgi:hypothetical protein